MTIEDDVAFLMRVPTLSLLGRDALRIIAIGAESRYVHEGMTLFSEGETADGAYVVQEGGFELTSKNGASSLVGRGALIGEFALLTETKRTTTATAAEPSTVVRIPRSLFLKMLEGYPDAAVRLREALMRRTNETAREFARVRQFLDSGVRS
jgi:CRP-like cAMP-binding protein